MNTKNILIGVVVAIIVLVGGFFLLNEYIYQEKQAEVPEVEGMSFSLISFNGEIIEESERYTLSFEEGSAFARFCNNMGGAYELDGNRMTALMASTLMYCSDPEWLMNAESAFQSMFSEGVSLSFDENDALTLSDDTNIFVFVRAE